MYLYEQFVKHCTAPFWVKRDGVAGLFNSLKELEGSQYWGQDRLIALQVERTKRLLIHAYKYTSYYKQVFDDAGLNPHNFRELNELEKLPLLTKDIIRQNLDSLIAQNLRPSDLHFSETGGTTGVKMKFYRDNHCLAAKDAALYRFEKWAGWDFGKRMGLVWPAQQDYVGYWTTKARVKNKLFCRQLVLPAAVLDEKSIADYVQLLLKKKPAIIRAFTSPLCEVAKYILDQGTTVTLNGVITTGEPLYGRQRRLLSEAFHCKVFDSYRSREAGPLAQECEKHDGMHVNAESLYLECVPPEDLGYFEPGLGEVVVTDLLNYGMPLIRYQIGDMGELTHESCACGRGLPRLKRLAGRTPDIFYAPNGNRIPAVTLVLYVVDEAPGALGQVQIIQDKIDHLFQDDTRSFSICRN